MLPHKPCAPKDVGSMYPNPVYSSVAEFMRSSRKLLNSLVVEVPELREVRLFMVWGCSAKCNVSGCGFRRLNG